MPNVERIKNGVVVTPDPKLHFKFLQDGAGNIVKVISYTIDIHGKVCYNKPIQKERK